jgi:hypothetical protein
MRLVLAYPTKMNNSSAEITIAICTYNRNKNDCFIGGYNPLVAACALNRKND